MTRLLKREADQGTADAFAGLAVVEVAQTRSIADEAGEEVVQCAGAFVEVEAEEKRMREKMKDATTIDVDPGALEILSTHPATDERMKNLQAKWDKLEKKTGYRNFDLNYTAFKDSLRSKLHSAETETDQKDK